jgi:SAM-dependent methyltransferase
MKIFNRGLLKLRREAKAKNFRKSDFIFKEIALRIIERIEDLRGDFSDILEIGARDGFLGGEIIRLKNGKSLIQTEVVIGSRSDEMQSSKKIDNFYLVDDENLEFADNSFDLILSNLNLHFINDIPAFLLNAKKMLKPNGVFIASFFGGETLGKLRNVLFEVEQKKFGGISPRIAPLIHVKDAGMLMQKAGFFDPVADSEVISVEYSDFFKLLHDLRNMGQNKNY